MDGLLVVSAYLVTVAGLVVLCLVGISGIRSPAFQAKAHLAVSFLPWVNLAGSYAWAFYVRKGMGYHHWPCMCDMPRVNEFNAVPLWSTILVLFFLIPVWVGWALIRHRQGMRDHRVLSTAVFASGIITLVLLLKLDPWGVWNWIGNHWA